VQGTTQTRPDSRIVRVGDELSGSDNLAQLPQFRGVNLVESMA